MKNSRGADTAEKFLKKARTLNGPEVTACYRHGLELFPGDAELQYSLGHALYWGTGVPQDYDEAALWLRRAADQGHTEAQDTLGVMYQLGAGVPASDIMAADLFRKSAEQGDTWAMAKLAYIYLEGHGVPRKPAEACFWYVIACELQSHPHDAFQMALCLDHATCEMTHSEIQTVQGRARKWLSEHPFGKSL